MRFRLPLLACAALLASACQETELPLASQPPVTPRFSTVTTASELFISEMIEGSSNNKAIEIYNGTGAPVDLAADGYSLQMYFNGSSSAGLTINLSGTVAAGDVHVVAHSASNASILAQADQTNGSGWFNGDDAIVLRRNGVFIDVLGQVGFDPGSQWGSLLQSTADNTIRRMSDICAGDANGSDAFDPAAEWDGYANDTFDGLGSHSATCSGGGGIPAVSATTPAAGAVGVTADASLLITFNRDVNVTGNWYAINCAVSRTHAAAVSGGPVSFTIDPATDFSASESCTVTIFAAGVSAQAGGASMAADFSFTFTVAAPPAPIVISELHQLPFNAESESWGEWFEVHNRGVMPVDLNGWKITSAGQSQHTINASVIVPPGGYVVLGRGGDSARNGGVAVDYNYFTGGSTVWLDSSDNVALLDAAGALIDQVAWTSAAVGVSRALRDPASDNGNADGAAWGYSTVRFGDGDYGTPGQANGTLSETAPVIAEPGVPARITVSRFESDYWVPAGFQKGLFATVTDGANQPMTGVALLWTSSNPSIATVNEFGSVTGVQPGTVTITATAPNGVSGRRTFNILPGDEPTTADYLDHVEFGVATDASPADDHLITHPQFVASYNGTRGVSNWVAWNLNGTHFGSQDRCECYTPDPQIPAGMTRAVDRDYTGSGYSRGHMTMSINRSTTLTENAATFYMTNILPQSSANNSGPWLGFENYLNGLATGQGREIYIIAGGDFSANPQTLRNEGRVQIPEHTWKIAVIMDRGETLDDVASATDVQVIAIRTPNVAGGGSLEPWQSYQTTVDAIEAVTGYDFLALLPDLIERLVERGGANAAPAVNAGSYTVAEGSALQLNGSASDPDGDAFNITWNFGDGATATGLAQTHTYAQDGSYTVTLTATDAYGATTISTGTVQVTNVTPSVSALPAASLLPGESYAATGLFSDPGTQDTWTATVDYGDGTGPQPLDLDGNEFALSHQYDQAGTFTITVTITDDDASTIVTANVTVLTAQQSLAQLITAIDATLSGGTANSLRTKLDAAAKSLDKGHTAPAANQLDAFINEVRALLKADRLSDATGQAWIAAAQRVLDSLN